MPLPYLKPYVDAPQQLERLAARGMAIDDRDFALRCLDRIGYYRLSAYWYPFRETCTLPTDPPSSARCDQFLPGTTFQQAIDFYLFDKAVRLMLADALERIEIGLRAALIEVVGRHGRHAHRDPRSFNANMTKLEADDEKTPLETFLDGLDETFRRSKEEFAKHFRDHYIGKPPIWIAAGAWDWGNLAYTVSHLSDRNKTALCARIDPRLERRALVSWITCLNEVRNVCAHHARLWNRAIINRPTFQTAADFPEFAHLYDIGGKLRVTSTTRLYGALMTMILVMKRLHPNTRWHIRFANLVRNTQLPQQIGVVSAGFPAGWVNQAIWQP